MISHLTRPYLPVHGISHVTDLLCPLGIAGIFKTIIQPLEQQYLNWALFAGSAIAIAVAIAPYLRTKHEVIAIKVDSPTPPPAITVPTKGETSIEEVRKKLEAYMASIPSEESSEIDPGEVPHEELRAALEAFNKTLA